LFRFCSLEHLNLILEQHVFFFKKFHHILHPIKSFRQRIGLDIWNNYRRKLVVAVDVVAIKVLMLPCTRRRYRSFLSSTQWSLLLDGSSY
jgi:hypothetical protein